MQTELVQLLQAGRSQTEKLCEPLEVEDYVIQSCDDVSPVKWHLAHTSWFFETFLFQPFFAGYSVFHPQYTELFNSYYNAVGPQFSRSHRGTLSRPTVSEVMAYRHHVTDCLIELLSQGSCPNQAEISRRVELGLHHEQQHQELMMTDIKHCFASNPLRPAYQVIDSLPAVSSPKGSWVSFDGGLSEIGHDGDGFAFDNEGEMHRVFLEPFQLQSELVTQREYLNFVEDGGYRSPKWWLSDGWDWVQQESWTAPLYWLGGESDRRSITLYGVQDRDPNAPVVHLSFFEADAYARWAGARLPTEFEWEFAARATSISLEHAGTLMEDHWVHPIGKHAQTVPVLRHMLGEVWEWTSSAYLPYPNYRVGEGALGEYNGKFMNGQRVLRGGSCVTSRSHIRTTYRNFFQPEKRWQFSGLRLAKGPQS